MSCHTPPGQCTMSPSPGRTPCVRRSSSHDLSPPTHIDNDDERGAAHGADRSPAITLTMLCSDMGQPRSSSSRASSK